MDIPELTIERSECDGVHLIVLSGELDLRGVGDLEAALAQPGDGAKVCLDLTELAFIDSTGLATVIRGHQALTGSGGAMAVACRGEGTVRRTFDTTGLSRLLTVAEDRAAALQALGG